MNKLTEDEIASLIKPRDPKTGVDEITEEMARAVDLDALHELTRSPTQEDEYIAGGALYKRDYFAPRAGTVYMKPAFAGRQVLIGKMGRRPIFSNGVWFSGGFTSRETIAEVVAKHRAPAGEVKL